MGLFEKCFISPLARLLEDNSKRSVQLHCKIIEDMKENMKNIDVHYSQTENQTRLTEFILVGLSSNPKVQIFLFFLFLIIYGTTLIGNFAIILIIKTEINLQTPMFFFLSHLAIVDISYSSVTVPKLLETIIAKKKSISLAGCITQVFLFLHFACADTFLLSAMAFDRYVAICDPLHYSIVMTKALCWKLVVGAWAMGFLDAIVNGLPLIGLNFCGDNGLSHYTCELPAVLNLSCSGISIHYNLLLASSLLFGFSTFLPILVSYIYIIATIFKIQSRRGRSKAFSTCSSHLFVVCMFYLSAFSRYLQPHSKSITEFDKLISVQYLILTPMFNPIIYSLNNKELKTLMWKRLGSIIKAPKLPTVFKGK